MSERLVVGHYRDSSVSMGGLGVVLEEPGRQSGLREELKELLGNPGRTAQPIGM
jgi:hypothetical protein